MLILAYTTAKIMDGTKSRSKGTPPIGAGNLYSMGCVEAMLALNSWGQVLRVGCGRDGMAICDEVQAR